MAQAEGPAPPRRRLLVLRHGSRPDLGPDPLLDPTGRREAEQVAAYLGECERNLPADVAPIVAIFSSPFRRALETATPVAKALQLPIRVEYGFCELLAHGWLHAADPLPALRKRPARTLPGFELLDRTYESAVVPVYPDVTGRMQAGNHAQRHRALARHRTAASAAALAAGRGSLLVVGHGSTHDFVAGGLCPHQHSFKHHTGSCLVDHCGITELVEEGGGWRLEAFGHTAWKHAKRLEQDPPRHDDGDAAAGRPWPEPVQPPPDPGGSGAAPKELGETSAAAVGEAQGTAAAATAVTDDAKAEAAAAADAAPGPPRPRQPRWQKLAEAAQQPEAEQPPSRQPEADLRYLVEELIITVQAQHRRTLMAMIEACGEPGSLAASRSPDGHSVLHLLAMAPPSAVSLRAAGRLLGSRAELDGRNSMGETPLIMAVRVAADCADHPGGGGGQRRLILVEELLRCRADPAATDPASGETALMECADFGDAALCRLLLSARADPRAKSCEGATARELAVQAGRCAVAELLLTAEEQWGRH